MIEQAIRESRAAIAEGRSVAEPLQETKVFPVMVTQMISVGEATGALDTMLGKIADFYDEEVDITVEALTSLLEPLLLVFLGSHHRRLADCHVYADLPDSGCCLQGVLRTPLRQE